MLSFYHYFLLIPSSLFPNLSELWKGEGKKKKRMFDVPSALYALYSLDLHRHVANIALQQQSCEGHDLGIRWSTCPFVVKKVL